MTASIDESKVQAAAKQYCLLLGIDPYEHVTRQVPDYDNLMVLRYETQPNWEWQYQHVRDFFLLQLAQELSQ